VTSSEVSKELLLVVAQVMTTLEHSTLVVLLLEESTQNLQVPQSTVVMVMTLFLLISQANQPKISF